MNHNERSDGYLTWRSFEWRDGLLTGLAYGITAGGLIVLVVLQIFGGLR